MAHRAVETLLGRLATDPNLLRRFQQDPTAVIGEFQDQGYDLTPVEREALMATDAAAIAALTARLDQRILKAECARLPATASAATPNPCNATKLRNESGPCGHGTGRP